MTTITEKKLLIDSAVDTRSLALRDTREFIELHKTLRPFRHSGFIPWSVYLNRAAEQGKTLFQLREYRYKPVTLRFEQIATEIADRCSNPERFLSAIPTRQPDTNKQERA